MTTEEQRPVIQRAVDAVYRAARLLSEHQDRATDFERYPMPTGGMRWQDEREAMILNLQTAVAAADAAGGSDRLGAQGLRDEALELVAVAARQGLRDCPSCKGSGTRARDPELGGLRCFTCGPVRSALDALDKVGRMPRLGLLDPNDPLTQLVADDQDLEKVRAHNASIGAPPPFYVD